MRLSIIIVNWNSGAQLAEVIASIFKSHQGLVESVIVVDNASIDDSLARVEKIPEMPFQLHFIQNQSNLGFAAACNQGAALASAPYLLFLNPDARLFENSLFGPLNFMEKPENEAVGICGIQLVDENGEISRSCSRFPTLLIFLMQSFGLNKISKFKQFSLQCTDWDHSNTAFVDQVIGAFFLVRRPLFEQLGRFDERFFVYFEELDFSRRAWQLGWKTIYFADAQAFHAGGGTSNQVKATRLFYFLRSRLLYCFKHYSLAEAWMVLLLTIFIESLSRIAFSLLRGRRIDIIHTLEGYGMLLKALPSIIP